MARDLLGLQESSIHTSADMPAILGVNPAPQVLIWLRIEPLPNETQYSPCPPSLHRRSTLSMLLPFVLLPGIFPSVILPAPLASQILIALFWVAMLESNVSFPVPYIPEPGESLLTV